MRRAEVLKEKYRSGLRRPEIRQKKSCWKRMIWTAAKPPTTVQPVFDDESNFINYTTLGRLCLDFLKGKIPGGWKSRVRKESQMTLGEICP